MFATKSLVSSKQKGADRVGDMLVPLYNLPKESFVSSKITIRRALAPEKTIVLEWVKAHFSQGWADECDVAFSRAPVSCYLAVSGEELLGFACYDATLKNFFGPTGVKDDARGQGIGKALLLRSFHAMRESGYGYGIIGSAGPVEFYEKVLGAIAIPNSKPGIYKGMLRQN
ncbi:GNAT family N-acetyltransferase [Shouchella clausii]|uniref:GNAT family N-acetyltransferase n=1 Tax=Shouchella clausii TaxID=79880 RepID=UPI0028975E7F|nr:GNAT family N-acetyltransferase [Shouchella clausii]